MISRLVHFNRPFPLLVFSIDRFSTPPLRFCRTRARRDLWVRAPFPSRDRTASKATLFSRQHYAIGCLRKKVPTSGPVPRRALSVSIQSIEHIQSLPTRPENISIAYPSLAFSAAFAILGCRCAERQLGRYARCFGVDWSFRRAQAKSVPFDR